jgi:hypothetical protein
VDDLQLSFYRDTLHVPDELTCFVMSAQDTCYDVERENGTDDFHLIHRIDRYFFLRVEAVLRDQAQAAGDLFMWDVPEAETHN